MLKRLPFALSLGLLLLGLASPALAIPSFARRYGVACHFCHEGFPKLNLMGQRFKERGFRLEKEDPFDFDKWMHSIPADLRATGSRLFIKDGEDGTFGFLLPVSAGNVGRRVSYWVDWGLILRSDTLTPPGEDNVASQGIGNAWARVEVLRDGRLYARGGRVEMDIPFTQIRTPNLFSYEILIANTGFETDTIGDHQDGLEVGGGLRDDFHWSAAIVRGRDEKLAGDVEDRRFEGNVFLRVAKRVGRNRYGAFSYIGRNHLAQPGIPLDLGWKDDLLRLGVDGSVWLQRLNIYGVAMYGRNSNSIATPQQPAGTGESLSFSGGFVQGDVHLRDTLALTARFNLVSRPASLFAGNETFTSFFPGVRWFVRDRFRLAFEYGFLNRGRSSIGAVQADLAF